MIGWVGGVQEEEEEEEEDVRTPIVKMHARRMILRFLPSLSVSAPEGKEPRMQPRENMAVIQPVGLGGGGRGGG